MESTNTVIEHGYFAVTGFMMYGGDIEQKKGFATFEEALIWAKGAINYDESKCATVIREKDVYDISVKKCNKTSPNKNQNTWKEVSNIFYGKRFKLENVSESKLLASSLAEFDYYFINSLDMYGADIRNNESYRTFNEAFEAMKNAINYDSTKCGSIFQAKPEVFVNYIKDAKGTSPAKSSYHVGSSTVFFGRKV